MHYCQRFCQDTYSILITENMDEDKKEPPNGKIFSHKEAMQMYMIISHNLT